jgi:hypothetical protein
MERYHEEYHRLRDKDAAIVKSYTEIYAPAMVSLLADGLAVLTLLVARIPMIQKLAWLCFFWIASIFVSVVTLHPIILAYTPPPEEHSPSRNTLERFMSWMMVAGLAWLAWLYGYLPGQTMLSGWLPGWPVTALLAIAFTGGLVEVTTGRVVPVYGQLGMAISRFTDVFGEFFGRVYLVIERVLIWLSESWRRPVMGVALLVLLAVGVYYQSQLKVGDTTPGAALLYPSHPYNVAFTKVNQKFTGASQLVTRKARRSAPCRPAARASSATAASWARRVPAPRRAAGRRHQGRRHAQQPRPLRALHGAAARGRRYRDGGVAAQEDLPHLPRG